MKIVKNNEKFKKKHLEKLGKFVKMENYDIS